MAERRRQPVVASHQLPIEATGGDDSCRSLQDRGELDVARWPKGPSPYSNAGDKRCRFASLSGTGRIRIAVSELAGPIC
jgi:hypothetical protein